LIVSNAAAAGYQITCNYAFIPFIAAITAGNVATAQFTPSSLPPSSVVVNPPNAVVVSVGATHSGHPVRQVPCMQPMRRPGAVPGCGCARVKACTSLVSSSSTEAPPRWCVCAGLVVREHSFPATSDGLSGMFPVVVPPEWHLRLGSHQGSLPSQHHPSCWRQSASGLYRVLHPYPPGESCDSRSARWRDSQQAGSV